MNNFEQAFVKAFDSIETTIEFNAQWTNGTGYFDGAVDMVTLEPCQRAKAVCALSQRRIIFVGTDLGTVVVFERYTSGTGSAFVLVSNKPSALNAILPNGSIDIDTFSRNCGYNSMNIGHTVRDLKAAFAKAAV